MATKRVIDLKTVIPYNIELNIGKGLDFSSQSRSTGVFNAPITVIYYFNSFTS